MPVYRKPHEKNFTVIDNGYLQDKDLGTKAKGLLTIMLSLPDDWKFSRDGLLAIYKEGETSLTATLNELKRKGYLSIRKLKSDSADADPFVYSYDIFESPDVRVPENRVLGNRILGNRILGNRTLGNRTLGNRILDDRVLENPVTYKELNNKILNDKEHSHQIRGGAGGGSDEDDDLNGEDGTEEECMDDIPISENGRRIATSRNARSSECPPDFHSPLLAHNDARKGRPCSGGVHASTVPDAIACQPERGAEYGAATVSPALRASAQTLSANGRRPPTNDHRSATSDDLLRQPSAATSPFREGFTPSASAKQTVSGSAGRPPTNDQRPATNAAEQEAPPSRPANERSQLLMSTGHQFTTARAYALRQGIALSENNLKELEDFAGKLGDEAVVWAVDEALAGGKKFYAYVRGILSKRVARGAKNMDDIRQMEERRHNGTDQCFGREGPGDAPCRFDCDITV